MMSLLKIMEIKKWRPVLSSSELPKGVLETKEGAFFAGFVSGALSEETGAIDTGTSKYAKGHRAHQIFSVEKTHGKARHLRNGGMSKITERLSSMKGFTQAYWGLRGSLVTLFKGVPSSRVTHLNTYVLHKSELVKIVKTKLQYENGGCFRPEEISYLQDRYQTQRERLNAFISRFENPDMELAESFNQIYAPIKTLVDAADTEIKNVLASRARILFPETKKKSIIAWRSKPLGEKLIDLSEEQMTAFRPESLPGIVSTVVDVNEFATTREYLGRKYPQAGGNVPIGEIVTSWYNSYESLNETA